MAENVHVVVRCRPMNKKEIDMKCKNIISINNCAVSLENPNDLQAPPKDFTFDSAYDINAPTEAIYNDICYSLVESVLEGYNATIFAYGQTGCGKSHTMQGPTDFIFNSNIDSIGNNIQNEKLLKERGIISRSFEHIFEAISVSTGTRYLAFVSYLEIYNENIRDLLNPSISSSNLQLKEIPGNGVTVQNLSTHTVHNSQECEHLFLIGTKNRMVGSTQMNEGSSRSHSIFTINLEQITTGCKGDDVDFISSSNPSQISPGVKKGKLNLVDLAGSERQNKTGATGERLKEATKINLSLSALGNVISALVDGKTKHIPYRDAKLTRLLQDSLGGNTKTLMIACIAPSDYNYDETLSTLRYASRAKNIHNKPKINEDPKDAMLREYQEEINKLKSLLNIHTTSNTAFIENLNLNNEKEKLRLKYEEKMLKLKIEHENEKKEKEELWKNLENLKIEYETKIQNLHKQNQEIINLSSSELENGSTEISKTMPNQTPLENYSNYIINNDAVIERLQMIKNALIGGEKSNDVHLKEKRIKKKIDAERRLSALAHALSRVEQNEDRDFLQDQYTSIQQELQVKTDALKKQRQYVKTLEREVTDLQSEFQLDRTDYLETIRRLEKNIKFYQYLIEIAIPLLRKDGRYWDLDQIKSEAVWNDDLKKWKFSDDILNRKKLPPAVLFKKTKSSASLRSVKLEDCDIDDENILNENLNENDPEFYHGIDQNIGNDINIKIDSQSNASSGSYENSKYLSPNSIEKNLNDSSIIDSYFRPKRANELLYQSRSYSSWKDYRDSPTNLYTASTFSTNNINNQLKTSLENLNSTLTNLESENMKNDINNNMSNWMIVQQHHLNNYQQNHQNSITRNLINPTEILLSKAWNGYSKFNCQNSNGDNYLNSDNEIVWDISNNIEPSNGKIY